MNRNPALLLTAITLIKKYVVDLDTKCDTCPGCGRNRWEDFDDHKADVELSGIVDKLRRIAAEGEKTHGKTKFVPAQKR